MKLTLRMRFREILKPLLKSMEEAKEVFTDKTAEMRSKKKLDLALASQIHVVTYTLEKKRRFLR